TARPSLIQYAGASQHQSLQLLSRLFAWQQASTIISQTIMCDQSANVTGSKAQGHGACDTWNDTDIEDFADSAINPKPFHANASLQINHLQPAPGLGIGGFQLAIHHQRLESLIA